MTMSFPPDITEKGSAAELDAVLVKEAAWVPLPLSHSLSTVGQTSREDEIELRDDAQAQPGGVALDVVREQAEDEAEEDEEIDTKPSAAASEAVQEILPVPASRSRSSSSNNSKHSNASKSKSVSEPVVVESPEHGMTLPLSRSCSSIKSNKSSRSNKSSVEKTSMKDDSSCSGQISKASHQSKISNKSSGVIDIAGRLVSVVPVHSSGGDNLDDVIVIKESSSNLDAPVTSGGNVSVKSASTQKKTNFFAIKSKKEKTTKKSDRSTVAAVVPVHSGDNHDDDMVVVVDSPEDAIEINTSNLDDPTPQVGNLSVESASIQKKMKKFNFFSTKSKTTKKSDRSTVTAVVTVHDGRVSIRHKKKKKFNFFTKKLKKTKDESATIITMVPVHSGDNDEDDDMVAVVKANSSVESVQDDTSRASYYAHVVTSGNNQFQSKEERKESADDVQVVLDTSTSTMGRTDKHLTGAGVFKGFDCNYSTTMWGNFNGWFKAPEEPKVSLNEETAADIRLAVELLKAQRALIKGKEEAVERAEQNIQEAADVKQFKEAEENKARLKKELSDAKRMEEAAEELVNHLFNSLSKEDRLEAARLSDDIAQAEKEASKADKIDYGCFCMDPYMCVVKNEYGDNLDDETDTSGSFVVGTESIRRTISDASSKASSKASIECSLISKASQASSKASSKLSSKATIGRHPASKLSK